MSVNDITGDRITSKKPSKKYDDGFDRIFRIGKHDTLEDSVKQLEQYLDKCKEENKKCLLTP